MLQTVQPNIIVHNKYQLTTIIGPVFTSLRAAKLRGSVFMCFGKHSDFMGFCLTSTNLWHKTVLTSSTSVSFFYQRRDLSFPLLAYHAQ